MKRNEIYIHEDQIYRILIVKEDKYFFLWISVKDIKALGYKIPSTPYTTRINKQKNRP